MRDEDQEEQTKMVYSNVVVLLELISFFHVEERAMKPPFRALTACIVQAKGAGKRKPIYPLYIYPCLGVM